MKKIFSQSQKILSRRHKKIISCDSEILFLRSRKDIRKNNILAIIFCSPDASHNFLGRKNTFSIFLVRKKCFFVVTKNFSWPRKCFSATAKLFLAIARNKFWLFPKNFAVMRKISETARNYSFNCEKKIFAVAKNDISLSQKIFANMKNCFLRSS